MASSYAVAKQKAEELIDRFALSTPVQVFQLADLLGIKWKTYKVDEFSSVVARIDPLVRDFVDKYDEEDLLGFYDTAKNLMLINDTSQPITRKRFTMAHEIGHFTLHHDRNTSDMHRVFMRQDIVEPRNIVEAEANYFAGYLLMPDKEIIKKLPYTDLMLGGESTISELAKMFAVSPDAMRIRLRTFKEENPALWQQFKMEEKL